jgi:hypothetical protein
MSDASAEAERRRQQALLAALAAPRADLAAPAGLRVYRANAHASARRALAATCPTLAALLGEEDFAALAREFWHAHPPVRGDLGEWGDALPDWIAAHAGLGEWPYLADCARLDLAVHRCERAADAAPDIASLGLLGSAEPSRLCLHLLPGVAVVASAWPLASIHAAHANVASEAAFQIARERIEQRRGEQVVVAREGWRAVVHPVETPALAFMQAVMGANDLARALDAAGDGFDFAAWLAAALRLRWLQRIELVAG